MLALEVAIGIMRNALIITGIIGAITVLLKLLVRHLENK